MPTYHRETWVAAPLSDVWEFHSRIDSLPRLTPAFMNLDVESATGPDGEPNPEVLTAGTRVSMSVRPFDAVPRQSWTSVVTEREEGEDRAYFRDEMEEGPFPRWKHTHRFYADDGDASGSRQSTDESAGRATDEPAGGATDETLVSDRVEFRLPGGPIGEALAEFAELGFEPMFRYRHRKTKELLE